MDLLEEIERRRTFAIISHPDAGKTTLTEKLLLYGGALHLAGSVTARKNQRASASDWMELEKKRGISISSTVLQFDYQGYHINLLDTPGHKDFSEDTYRVLTAVDAAIMVIDAGKGIESQTLKLFEVCRQRNIPIFTFMNKLDRPTRNLLELIDEVEDRLQINVFPMNWPLGTGSSFRGVFDRLSRNIHLFERVTGGIYKAPVHVGDALDPSIPEQLDETAYHHFKEEIALLDAAGSSFDPQAVLSGDTTPVFFGSAINNFGVQLLLDTFVKYSPPPIPRRSTNAAVISPSHEKFSGFIFKIQGNMDPRHRDKVLFLRVCSGKFSRDMQVIHQGSGRKIRLSNAHKLFAREREIAEDSYAGDILGLSGHWDFNIGDTLTEDVSIIYNEIPRFPPECFAFLHNPSPSKFKSFRKGLEHFIHERIVHPFFLKNSAQRAPLLGAVGPLQFEVLQYRLQTEYGVESKLETASWVTVRWVGNKTDSKTFENLSLPTGCALAQDREAQNVILFPSEWILEYFVQNHSEIYLSRLPATMVVI